VKHESPTGVVSQIYVMDQSGTNVRKLSNNAGNDLSPGWSPDGTRIAFISNRSGANQIWVMNADGSAPAQLTHVAGDILAFAWQPLPLSIAGLSPTPEPAKSSRPSPSASVSGTRCITGRSTGASGPTGKITVCPDAGPVGSLVTVSGDGCHNPGDQTQLVEFLGPTDYIGTGGGGVGFQLPVDLSGHFYGTFRIPATYTGGGDKANPVLPTRPGLYHFGTYPLGACWVNFIVTAPR
jgi:WD40-like Beta Propeller Repeat